MDLSKLYIIFIVGTLGQGGAERQLYYILKILRSKRVNITILSLTQGEHWEELIRQLGIPVIWVGEKQNRLIRLAKIIKNTRESKATIIQSHHFYTNLYAGITGRILGIQNIGAIRNDVLSEIRANGHIIGNFCLHTPRRLAANSYNGRKNAINSHISPDRIDILPNVIDCEHFCPSNKSQMEPFTVLTIGRLVRQKKQEHFLECLAKARDNSSLKLEGWIVGGGPLEGYLKNKAKSLSLGPSDVHFYKSISDPVTIYQKSDVFLFTSEWEGTPNVVMEAMSCGLPVIATRVGGFLN